MNLKKSPVLSETVEKIRSIIKLNTDIQLPSVRTLSRQCEASPVTILRAIGVLKKEGLIEGKWGSRHHVTVENITPEPATEFQMVNKVKKTIAMIKHDIIEGKYQTHQPLPSIKQLTTHYNVSYPTMKKALAVLNEQKIIKQSGAKYHFFTNHVKPKTKIAIVAFGLGRNSIKIVSERERNFYRILSTIAMDQNVILDTVCCNDYLEDSQFYTTDNSPLPHYLKNKEIAGIILSSYHMKDSAECLRKLLLLNIPISAWVEDHRIMNMIGCYSRNKRNLSFFDSSYSTLPGFEVGRYLIGKGHKKIAYISPFHESPWSQNRFTGLKNAAVAHPDVRIYSFLCTEYLNDYFYLKTVLDESLFDKHCSIHDIKEMIHPFLRNRIEAVRYEHDILLRDSRIFSACENLIKDASADRSITAWVCANDHIAVLITDYWDFCAIPFSERPALVGFDNSFNSFERNITSYEFNISGEVQQMLHHLLYPTSSYMLNDKPAIRVSGRIVERASCYSQ